MVFFFRSSDGHVMYMGADKYENEDLIKYGWPEDIWFHVDDMSSAHVYLRLERNQRLEDLPPETLMECAQLVKANSIEGCKMREVTVIYTRWRNLNKTSSMEVGAIGFHDRSKVKSMRVVKENAIVNAINRTKEERFPNLAEEQTQRAAEHRAELKEAKRQQDRLDKLEGRRREEDAKMRSYDRIMDSDRMRSNKDVAASADASAARDFEDSFM